jgi:isopenicillin N synthase-like dioxygenase
MSDATQARTLTPDQVPLVSLATFLQGDAEARDEQVARMRRSLEEHDFFALVDHGLSKDMLEAGYRVAREFFALPDGQKSKLHKGRGFVGYIPFGVEQAIRGTRPDFKELWHSVAERAPTHSERRTQPEAYPPNPWPSRPVEFEAVLRGLHARFEAMVDGTLRMLACTAELPESWLADAAEGGPHLLRLIHYPPLPNHGNAELERAVEHTGAGIVGFTPPATSDGLAIYSRTRGWQRLSGFDDTIVVTVADMTERLTNRLVRSSLHRVENPEGPSRSESRYAIVYFVSARPTATLDCPPQALGAGNPRHFPAQNAWDFVTERMTDVWLNQASAPYRAYFKLKKRLKRLLR